MKTYYTRSFQTRRFFGGFVAFGVALFVALGWPHPAAAQIFATTMGDMICNAANELGPFTYLFNGVAYLAGALFVGQGLMHLKGNPENPNNHPMHKALAHIIGGAFLLALPNFANTLVNSLFFVNDGGGLSSCGNYLEPGNGGGNAGLDVLLSNLINNIADPLDFLVSAAAIVAGVFLLVRGLIKGAKYGQDPKANSPTHILSNLIIGAILIVVGQSFSVVMTSLFGFGSSGMLGMVGGTDAVTTWTSNWDVDVSQQFITAVVAALTFIQLIGMIAFVRGWYIVKNAIEGSGQATVAQGFTHIIGGVLAINIYYFLEVMDATFGTGLLSS